MTLRASRDTAIQPPDGKSRSKRGGSETADVYHLPSISELRKNPPFDDELVDTQTVALALKMSASYLEKLRVKGGGPPYLRIGNIVRYRFGDIMPWAKERFGRSSTSESSRE